VTVRTNWYTENSGPATLGTSGTVADDLMRGVRMTDSSVRVPYDDAPRCPQCDVPGWHSAARSGAYDGHCGSRWYDEGGIDTGRACMFLEQRRDLIEELRFELASNRGEVAA